jgi:hypothetical protein
VGPKGERRERERERDCVREKERERAREREMCGCCVGAEGCGQTVTHPSALLPLSLCEWCGVIKGVGERKKERKKERSGMELREK